MSVFHVYWCLCLQEQSLDLALFLTGHPGPLEAAGTEAITQNMKSHIENEHH